MQRRVGAAAVGPPVHTSPAGPLACWDLGPAGGPIAGSTSAAIGLRVHGPATGELRGLAGPGSVASLTGESDAVAGQGRQRRRATGEREAAARAGRRRAGPTFRHSLYRLATMRTRVPQLGSFGFQPAAVRSAGLANAVQESRP